MDRTDLSRIRRNPWFASLDGVSKHALLSQAQRLRLQRGQFAMRQGDPPDGFYGVVSGLMAASSLLADGREVIYGLLEPGEWFGEASCIDGLPRTTDVAVLQPAELLHVPAAVFEALMDNAGFARAAAMLATARARVMFGYFEDAVVRSVRARLVRRLLRLARDDAPGSWQRVIPITHEKLALMLGVTRQTLSLELKALAAAGVLSLSYGRIELESIEALQALSEP